MTMHLNLRSFYVEMKLANLSLHGFKFGFNDKQFDVLFEAHGSPFKLIILQFFARFELTLSVLPGFTIDTQLSQKDYYALCDVLGLKKDPNKKFSPSVFFEAMNNHIPLRMPAKMPSEAIKYHYKDKIHEADKIYYCGHINWELHAKGNVRDKNLDKTLRLYGLKFYELCKRHNISIRYTDANNGQDISELLQLFKEARII
jgi:hypothetical protein